MFSMMETNVVWKTDLRDESRQATNGIDDGTASSLVVGEVHAEPSTPGDDGDDEKGESKGGNDFGEEPDLALHGGELELPLARHRDDAAHNGLIADGEDDAGASSLDDKGGREGQITGFERVVRGGIDGTRDHVTDGN